jgi:hypothetical protein
MKHTPRIEVIERRIHIGLYLNQQLRDLETYSQSVHRDRVMAMVTAVRECLEQELLDTPPSQLVIESVTQPAAITPAQMDQADEYLQANAWDMIQQAQKAEPAQTDYNAQLELLEQQEKGVPDEVGTKV